MDLRRREVLAGVVAGASAVGGCQLARPAPSGTGSGSDRTPSSPDREPVEGCLATSPCSLDGTLSAPDRDRTVARIRAVRRQTAFLTAGADAGVVAPDGRAFLLVRVAPYAGDGIVVDPPVSPPRPAAFALIDGERTYRAATDGLADRMHDVAAYAAERGSPGWLGFALPTPYRGGRLALVADDTDGRVPLPASVTEGLAGPSAFGLRALEAPERVAADATVELTFVVENTGDSDGVFHALVGEVPVRIAVPAGGRRRRTVPVVTPARGDAGQELRIPVRWGGGTREVTVGIGDDQR